MLQEIHTKLFHGVIIGENGEGDMMNTLRDQNSIIL